MPQNTTTQQFLAGNAAWLKRQTYQTPPPMTELRKLGKGPEAPLMIVTCMDPRVSPSTFLGGDIIFGSVRNAGGRVNDDVVKSIVVLRSLNTVSEGGTVVVVHHTDCGMTHLSQKDILGDVKRRTPNEAGRVETMELGLFGEEGLEESVREDVGRLREEKVLEGMDVFGFVFVTETGELTEIV